MNIKVLPLDFSLDTNSKIVRKLLLDSIERSERLPVRFYREGVYKTPSECWSELYDPIEGVWVGSRYSAMMFDARLQWIDVFHRYSKRDIELLEKCAKEGLLDKRMNAIVTTWNEAENIRWTSMKAKYNGRKAMNRLKGK